MPHNPILSEQTLPRLLPVFLDIPKGALGLLYSNDHFIRALRPGQQPTLQERASMPLTSYIVDMVEHPVSLDFQPPDRSSRDRFPLRIDIDYRVADPQFIIDNHITDTETLIVRKLEPKIRKASRRILINQYQSFQQEVEDLITPVFFEELGLELLRCDVNILVDEDFLRRVQSVDITERARRLPQRQTRQVKLPSNMAASKFEASVEITYQVDSTFGDLPTDTPVEAEAMLWPTIESVLRGVTRQYEGHQAHVAETQVNTAIRGQTFGGYGIRVVGVNVSIDPDESAIERAKETAQLEHNRAIQKLTNLIRDDAAQGYAPYLDAGSARMMLLELARDPNRIEQITARLREQEQTLFQHQVEILKSALAENVVWEGPLEQAIQSLLNIVSGSVRSAPELPPVTPAPQISIADTPTPQISIADAPLPLSADASRSEDTVSQSHSDDREDPELGTTRHSVQRTLPDDSGSSGSVTTGHSVTRRPPDTRS